MQPSMAKSNASPATVVTKLQRIMCADEIKKGLDVPSMLFDLLRELPPTDRRLAEAGLNLFRRLVARGDRVVQEELFRKLMSDTRRCERVFYQLESRLAQGAIEAKSAKTRHINEADRAAEAAKSKA